MMVFMPLEAELIDPAGTSDARYLGYQGDLEIRWLLCATPSSPSTLPAFSREHFLRP